MRGEPVSHRSSLFADVPDGLPTELIETLVGGRGVRIERIVSQGQASEEGFWYDQDQEEFVLLVAGKARLRFADKESELVELKSGDWINIAAHRKHRVE